MNIISICIYILQKTKMTEENKEVLNQNVVQNWNPYDLVDNASQVQSENSSTLEKKESGQFFKKIIKSVAKMAWLPDPETGKPSNEQSQNVWNNTEQNNTTNETANMANTNTTLEQDVTAQESQKEQEEEKKKFSFDSIMSGVSGVLDKIEKKVEETTGIDLDAPLKKREENLSAETWVANNEAWQQNTENEVAKNNDEYLSENH